MKKVIATAAALAVSFGLAQAQEPNISNPRGMVTYFDTASLGPILTEMKFVWQERQAQTGQRYIDVSFGGDLVFMMIPTACQGADHTRCVGLNIVAILTGEKFNYQTVTAFNQRYWFSTAGMAPGDRNAYISRYEISDYGIPRGNVAESVKNLLILAAILRDELGSSKMTVSLEGYADDLSARSLNSNALVQVAGAEAVQPVTKHRAAMEQSIEFVLTLISEEDTPRNKVKNITAQ